MFGDSLYQNRDRIDTIGLGLMMSENCYSTIGETRGYTECHLLHVLADPEGANEAGASGFASMVGCKLQSNQLHFLSIERGPFIMKVHATKNVNVNDF